MKYAKIGKGTYSRNNDPVYITIYNTGSIVWIETFAACIALNIVGRVLKDLVLWLQLLEPN